MNINNNWFSLDKSEKEDLEKKITDLVDKVKLLQQKFNEMEINQLKLTNLLLETEISKERFQNLLLRKHISFPFTSTLLTKKFGK